MYGYVQMATLAKELGQVALSAAGRKWDLGYDRSCWRQTKARDASYPLKPTNKCPDNLTYDKEFDMCFGECPYGGEGAGFVCVGTCPKSTTMRGAVCVDNDLDDPDKKFYNGEGAKVKE